MEGLTQSLDGFLAEEEAAQCDLDRLKLQMKGLESRIDALSHLIDTTRSSKEKMEVIADDLRRLLLPVKRVPTEILIRIFSFVIEQAHQDRQITASQWQTPRRDKTSLLLACVCTRWRQNLHRNQELWKYLEFSVSHKATPKEVARKMHKFQHYITRGSPSQQTLFVRDLNTEKYDRIHEKMSPNPTQFHAIRMDVFMEIPGKWDVNIVSAKDITIYRHKGIPLTFFVPLLRLASKLIVYGSPPNWGIHSWALLEKLTLRDFCRTRHVYGDRVAFTSDSMMEVLNAAPLLVQLYLDFEIHNETPPESGDINASHIHLKYLALHFGHFKGGKGPFSVRLDLPALQTLEFLSIQCESAHEDNEESLLGALSPKTLIMPRLSKHEIGIAAQILQQLRSVECLQLLGHNNNALIASIYSSYYQLPLISSRLWMPKLVTLHIEHTDIQANTLRQFVEAKLEHRKVQTEGVSALEVVEMYETPSVQPAEWWIIQGFLAQGRLLNRDPLR